MKKDCCSRGNCYSCKSGHHHTAICDRKQERKYEGKDDEIKRKETQTHHISANKLVLLQTADAEICDIEERRSRTIKVLLDPASQKIYVSQRTADALKLTPACEEHMVIKTFGSTAGKPMAVKEYEFIIKGRIGTNLYEGMVFLPFAPR